jgi:anti-anti-sigma regulatory factor
MLRVTRMPSVDSTVRLQVEGKLLGPWAGELRTAYEAAASDADVVVLDLAAVVFVDQAGLDLLHELMDRGVPVARCSHFVKELLSQGKL